MKKMIGLVALCVIGFVVVASAQEAAPAPAAAPAASPLESAASSVAAAVAPAAQAVASAVETAVAGEITVKGKVSVVKDADGALQAIYINPEEGHGYKIDTVNGDGKLLADKGGQIVEVKGVDANRLFNVKSISVVE